MIKKVSIIVPLFNEEENLMVLHQEISVLRGLVTEYEIVYVDDGSKDGGLGVLKKIQEQDSHVKIISFRRNYGQTAAMGAGVKHVIGEVIVFLDADMQNDPKDIPALLQKLEEGYDVVSGWRKNRHDDFFRVLFSQIANKMIAGITGIKLNDYGCTLKAYRSDVIKNIDFYGEMHRLLPAYASWYGAKVAEVVVNHRPRIHGSSKYGFSRIFKVLMDLLVAKFLIGYSAKPIYFFGALGAISFVIGLLSFVAAIILRIFGTSFIQTPLLLLTVMMFVLGIQLISVGLLADLILRSYYHKEHSTYSIKHLIGF
ncbi:MAG: Glycosyl transferase family 2 [Candidatus Magasanikbacteria bacterium GW2011_GWC2_41_17]|uniref:Glycosyl transferase family 2 n=2 Tax=Candidatus Magasanikiibacteriota TaxID=1752731 RepID=A0A0G0ZL28_9BACT|nr:MAG: Glycosyl transferase family 2 [Candidatus Magasanikbacteria bacterium GW2011_GWC2_41_17]KKS13663.1 MAG: Glycosyl transferase family 2 [Candidatus Magasanikbacteria bacterium GW2011_GWA2_41_55]